MKSDKTLKKWYRIINKRFFHNELPGNVCVRWGSEEDLEEDERWEEKYNGMAFKEDAGSYHYGTILISNSLRTFPCTRLATLVHEMCHLATDFRDEHGPAFEEWRKIIGDRGVFKKSALLRNLTIF